jgi:hypothetical protein
LLRSLCVARALFLRWLRAAALSRPLLRSALLRLPRFVAARLRPFARRALVAFLAIVARSAAPHRPTRPLLELADLLFHEPPRLRLLFLTPLFMTAVGAALPPFGKRLAAGVAENALRQWHRRNRRALYTSAVDENRRRTLLALVQLAEEDSPTSCWDDGRAVELLRNRSSAEELRELGASERLIEHVFSRSHAR